MIRYPRIRVPLGLTTAALLLLAGIVPGCQREKTTERVSRPTPLPAAAEEEVPDIPAKELLITEQAFVKVARKATPSVVNISSVHLFNHPSSDEAPGEGSPLRDFFGDLLGPQPRKNLRQKSLGSGFIISSDGLILTNNHVIAEAERITVRLSDRREFVGTVVGKDPKSDLALLRIRPEEALPMVQLGDSERLMVGEWAIAIGNPFGLDHTVTVGVISATGRTNLGLTDHDNFIQTDASINFGNSGGPLLNAKGQVIGINTAIVASGQGIGFAIPINAARSVVSELIEKGKVSHGWLGVRIENPSETGANFSGNQKIPGVRVQEVVEKSPAERSGIKKGDVLSDIGKDPIRNIGDFQNKIRQLHAGDLVDLTVRRPNKELHLQVVLDEAPSSTTVP